MALTTTAPRITILILAVVIGIARLLSPQSSHVDLIDDTHVDVPTALIEATFEDVDKHSPAVANEQFGNLVIALQDRAMKPLTNEQVQLRGTWLDANEVIAFTNRAGEAA